MTFCLEVRTAQPSFLCLRLHFRRLFFHPAVGKFAAPSSSAASSARSGAKNAAGKKPAAGTKKAPGKKPAAVSFEDQSLDALLASPVTAKKATRSKEDVAAITVQYTCVTCKYPPCQGCKTTPRSSYNERYTIAKMPYWTCPECLKHSTLCMFCGEGKQVGAFHKQELQRCRRDGELSEAKCSECKANKRKTRTELTCIRCSNILPQPHFDTHALNAVLAENRIHELYCVKCAIGPERSQWWKLDAYKCAICGADKQRNAFAAVDLKTCAKGARECEACKYPVCALCKQQPDDKNEYQQWSTAWKKQRKTQGSVNIQPPFTCMACQYPPCHSCKVAKRPDGKEKYMVQNLPEWFCRSCKRK